MVSLDSCGRVQRCTPECRGACHARRTSCAILYGGSLGCFLLRPVNEKRGEQGAKGEKKGRGGEGNSFGSNRRLFISSCSLYYLRISLFFSHKYAWMYMHSLPLCHFSLSALLLSSVRECRCQKCGVFLYAHMV